MATTIHPSQEKGVARLVGVNLVGTFAWLHPHEVDDLTNSIWWREKERKRERERERERERVREREKERDGYHTIRFYFVHKL
jgi:hypothetical protein